MRHDCAFVPVPFRDPLLEHDRSTPYRAGSAIRGYDNTAAACARAGPPVGPASAGCARQIPPRQAGEWCPHPHREAARRPGVAQAGSARQHLRITRVRSHSTNPSATSCGSWALVTLPGQARHVLCRQAQWPHRLGLVRPSNTECVPPVRSIRLPCTVAPRVRAPAPSGPHQPCRVATGPIRSHNERRELLSVEAQMTRCTLGGHFPAVA